MILLCCGKLEAEMELELEEEENAAESSRRRRMGATRLLLPSSLLLIIVVRSGAGGLVAGLPHSICSLVRLGTAPGNKREIEGRNTLFWGKGIEIPKKG